MADRPENDDTAIRSSPGASSPGEPGYEGDVAVGDEGAAAGPEAYQGPSGPLSGIADPLRPPRQPPRQRPEG